MSWIPFEYITSSKLFTFCIGPELKEFTIHSRIATAQSQYFDTLINGNFKEARECRAEITDVDEKTFAFFTQYAYTGDYGDLVEEATQPVLAVGPKKKCPNCLVSSPRPVPRAETTTAEKQWNKLTAKVNGSSDVKNNEGLVKELHAGVLVWHARVYVFAECYGVLKLRDMAYNNLARALMGLAFDDKMVQAVVSLVQYAFEDGKPEELKSLVVSYASCKAEGLTKEGKFREVLVANPDFSVALIDAMLGRLECGAASR